MAKIGGHCSKCGKPLTNSTPYTYEGQIYCYDCFQEIAKQAEDKEKKKQNLFSYIKKLFGVSDIPESVIDSINALLKDKGKNDKPMTINGIQKTLEYYYGYLGNDPADINIIRFIIVKYYQETYNHLVKQHEIDKKNAEFKDDSKVVTYRIDPNKLFEKARSKGPTTNIEDL